MPPSTARRFHNSAASAASDSVRGVTFDEAWALPARAYSAGFYTECVEALGVRGFAGLSEWIAVQEGIGEVWAAAHCDFDVRKAALEVHVEQLFEQERGDGRADVRVGMRSPPPDEGPHGVWICFDENRE